jgi:uncharacterized damage-inducible protein DinB
MWRELLDAWRINNRITLLLLDGIDRRGLECTLSRRGGRDVGRQFAHMHNTRIELLQRWAPELANGARLFASKEEPGGEELAAAIGESGERVARYIPRAAEGMPGVKTFKRGLVVSISYLISHDSHHRGSIILTLKQCGQKVSKEVQSAIWDWERR